MGWMPVFRREEREHEGAWGRLLGQDSTALDLSLQGWAELDWPRKEEPCWPCFSWLQVMEPNSIWLQRKKECLASPSEKPRGSTVKVTLSCTELCVCIHNYIQSNCGLSIYTYMYMYIYVYVCVYVYMYIYHNLMEKKDWEGIVQNRHSPF